MELSGYIYIAFSLFWGVVAIMFHRKLNIPLPAALALGLVLQVVGFAIMLLIGLVFKTKQSQAVAYPTSTSDPFATPGFSQADPFGPGAFGVFDSYGEVSKPRTELGLMRIVVFGLAGLGIVLLVLAAFLPWFYSLADIEVSIGLISSGIEVWLLASVLAVVAAVLLSLKRWSPISPILVGYFSSWWVALSLASMTNRLAFVNGVTSIFQLPNLITYQGGGSVEVVSQRIGEAWLALLPAGLLMLAAAYLFALQYSKESSSANTNLL